MARSPTRDRRIWRSVGVREVRGHPTAAQELKSLAAECTAGLNTAEAKNSTDNASTPPIVATKGECAHLLSRVTRSRASLMRVKSHLGEH